MQSLRAWVVLAFTVVAVSSCAARGAAIDAPSGGSETSWRYEVQVTRGAGELLVDGWLPPGSLSDLVVRRGAERFIHDVEVQADDGWHDAQWDGTAHHAPECWRGCHVRYRFALREAADKLADADLARAWGDVVEASPSMWLLRPTLAPGRTRYRFHVRTPAGLSFVTGVFETTDGPPGTYEADASTIGMAPYAAFGPVRLRRVEAVQGTTIDLAITPATYAVSDDALVAWVARSARTMARFFGCFPVERTAVLVVPARGNEVHHGETMGDGGATIVVEVGDTAELPALDDDWVLPHEMAHLAVPSVSRKHHWLEEGVAVYVQPIARARAGEISPEEVWREFALGMPQGEPGRGDHGLDNATSWARTYWGGATFCLLADVEMRRRTEGRVGFEDALRGVLANGGSVTQVWDFDRLLETADGTVGVPVLRPMHERMGRLPIRIDLPRLFRDLGVVVQGTTVTLVDDAPLAATRRAITELLPPGAPEPSACRWAAPGSMAQR
jgi:hypothetical protein